MCRIIKIFVDIVGLVVTAASIIVSIYLARIATKADRELKETAEKMDSTLVNIKALTDSMNLAIKRIEPVVQKTYSTIAYSLKDKPIEKDFPQNHNDSTPAPGQIEEEWKNGCNLLNGGKYKEAIMQFENIANREEKLRSEAYYYISIAFARLSNRSKDKEQESYRRSMMDYLRRAALLYNENAQNLLHSFGESW